MILMTLRNTRWQYKPNTSKSCKVTKLSSTLGQRTVMLAPLYLQVVHQSARAHNHRSLTACPFSGNTGFHCESRMEITMTTTKKTEKKCQNSARGLCPITDISGKHQKDIHCALNYQHQLLQ